MLSAAGSNFLRFIGFYSLVLATCASRSLTEVCSTSLIGCGQMPIASTATASSARTNSFARVDVVQFVRPVRSPRAEHHPPIHPKRVGCAEHSVVAASAAYQKLTFIAPNVTRNSPTKPLVPGRPELAIANNMKKDANTGMVFTTPP